MREKKNKKMLERILIFLKAQISAFTGGIVDYGLMIFITEVFNIHYYFSIIISGSIGAIINFSLNKTWTFRAKDHPYQHSTQVQLIKFIVVVGNSILLKSGGTFLVTNFLHIDYKISRIIVDLIVSLAFNFTLQKYWVFKKKKEVTL